MKHLVLILAVTLSLNTYPNACVDFLKGIFKTDNAAIGINPDAKQFEESRKYFADLLRENNIPAFHKKDPNGVDIPYVLINRESAKKLSSFMDNSYGTQIVLQPDYNNDHGLLRIGQNIVDVDLPGYRGFGELHGTGIAWKDVGEYLKRRNPNSQKILEVSYLLTPEENKVIEYYQRVRRAAIFRVPFTFGGNKPQQLPFMLKAGGEHCFIFCKSTGVRSQLGEISNNLKAMGVGDPEEYVKRADVSEAIEKFVQKINSVPSNSVSADLVSQADTLDSFKGLFPDQVQTPDEQVTFLRWLISYDSSSRYGTTLRNLGVTSDFGIQDSRSARATAVFIYDEGADPEAFKQGVYETKGKFFSWPQTGHSPL